MSLEETEYEYSFEVGELHIKSKIKDGWEMTPGLLVAHTRQYENTSGGFHYEVIYAAQMRRPRFPDAVIERSYETNRAQIDIKLHEGWRITPGTLEIKKLPFMTPDNRQGFEEYHYCEMSRIKPGTTDRKTTNE